MEIGRQLYLVMFDREPEIAVVYSTTRVTFKVRSKPNLKWYKRKRAGKRYYSNNLNDVLRCYDSLGDIELDRNERRVINELYQYMVTTPTQEVSLEYIRNLVN